MVKPNIIKILHTRKIGRYKSDYDVEQHIGLDSNGVTWNFIAHVDVKTGKVIDTSDYREMRKK